MKKLLLLCFFLSACAQYTWYQNGEPRTWDDHDRALAECERKVGGQNYAHNINQCFRAAGWTYGPINSVAGRTPSPQAQKGE